MTDDSIFREGGPHDIRRRGPDEYELRINIPTDEKGMAGRECPEGDCSPGYFKVKLGTGITDGQESAFCPYCRYEAEPGDFLTKAQTDYALGVVADEALVGIGRMFKKALGIGPSGKKKYDAGLFSLELSIEPSRRRPLSRPVEEELRRDLVCPHCFLVHAVFGLATWCPDCGTDIFLVHLEQEFSVVKRQLSAIDARRAELGPRVAARDVENALEDTVSIFEAVLKGITRRHLAAKGYQTDEIDEILARTVRNSYQNIDRAAAVFLEHVGVKLYAGVSEDDVTALKSAFEKRHPITHNLGIIDRKYLERARSGELEGREIRIEPGEVDYVIDICRRIINDVYQRLFSAPTAETDDIEGSDSQ